MLELKRMVKKKLVAKAKPIDAKGKNQSIENSVLMTNVYTLICIKWISKD